MSAEDGTSVLVSDSAIHAVLVDWTLGDHGDHNGRKQPHNGHTGAIDLLKLVRSRNDKIPIFLMAERDETSTIPIVVMQMVNEYIWTLEDTAAFVGGPLSKIARIMVERAGSDRSPDEVEQHLVDTMATLLESGAEHRPGAPELLDDLTAHGVPCALVSSSPRVLVDAVLRDVGGDHFALTLAGDEVARTKPFPDPYVTACNRLGVDPGRTVVLEDSPVGVAAAEAAGCVVVAVPFVVPIDEGPRLHVVSSLLDLDTERLVALVSGDLAAAG
jgi:HAD superfamily hydrolase (TIGR01509 family)